ncbi:hypothetical protein A7X12_19465 [Sphingomonas sp. TDK1]|nr:hypothetical protein A7X12_19465 [Sphingomonas sp. TDK1]
MQPRDPEGELIMTDFANIARWASHRSALPPVTPTLIIDAVPLDPDRDLPAIGAAEPQPISAFVCIIEYEGNTRLITCRRFDRIGEAVYVGAICHSARAYRQFRSDRVSAVYDAATGEVLGDGSYFERFSVDSQRERAATWNLSPARKATLVAGLNVLAFMARCDGYWHPLEADVVEGFICSMWLRKEWEGEPPLADIVAHAQRLSPDANTFFHALRHYAGSRTSTRILCGAVSDLITADGVICSSEARWGAEIDAFLRDYREDEFERYFGSAGGSHPVASVPPAGGGTVLPEK